MCTHVTVEVYMYAYTYIRLQAGLQENLSMIDFMILLLLWADSVLNGETVLFVQLFEDLNLLWYHLRGKCVPLDSGQS